MVTAPWYTRDQDIRRDPKSRPLIIEEIRKITYQIGKETPSPHEHRSYSAAG